MGLQNPNVEQRKDEITLRDLILNLKRYFKNVVKNWLFIGICALLGLAIYIYSYVSHKNSYKASITFMVNEDEGSSLGGIASMLGSFGGLLGGSGSEYNLDKILQISKSNRLAQKIVLSEAVVNNRRDYLGNHIIESLDTMQEWVEFSIVDRLKGEVGKKKLKKNYRFSADSLNYQNQDETWVLKRLIKKLFGDAEGGILGMVKNEINELTGIMEINVSSFEEELSIEIANSLFEELSDFYIVKSTEKQRQTFSLMKTKHDSILQELRTTEYSLATFSDRNQGIFRKQDLVRQDRLKRDLLINGAALGEAKKNLEISDFALKNKTPFIQVIDRPFMPLSDSQPGLIFSVLLGLVFGALLGILITVLRLFFKDVMTAV